MQTTFRRLSAGIAAGALALTGLVFAAAPANAVTACGLGQTCSGALTGKLGTTTFEIKMPQKFNGTVLLWSHGYRIATQLPEALAAPLGIAANPVYQKVSQPLFVASTGSDVAYVGSGVAESAPSAEAAQQLLAQGYALAGAGWAKQGWATAEGIEAGQLLHNHIRSGAIKGVKRTYSWGASLGSFVAMALAERNPRTIQGTLPTCGAQGGPLQAFSSAMTVVFTYKTLVDPTIKGANYASPVEAIGDLGKVLSAIGRVSGGDSGYAPNGYPVAQANLLAGLLAGLPAVSTRFDGTTLNPFAAQNGTAAALAGGYSPVSGGQSAAAAMLQNVAGAAALGILGRFELEQQIRVNGNVGFTANANFNDNVNVSYSSLLSPEQRGEFGDTLNASTIMPNLLNAMLAKLDESKGNPSARFPANPAAVKYVNNLPAPDLAYTGPIVQITTMYDSILPAGNQERGLAALKASAKKQGITTPRIGNYYTEPPADGWTTFQPGAKGADAAASEAKANSGVGHCNFALGGGSQLVGAVSTLNRLVNAKTPAQVKAAIASGYRIPQVNTDRFFLPEPLKVTTPKAQRWVP